MFDADEDHFCFFLLKDTISIFFGKDFHGASFNEDSLDFFLIFITKKKKKTMFCLNKRDVLAVGLRI